MGVEGVRRRFSELGRKLRSGSGTDSDRRAYKQLSELVRDQATAMKCCKWQRLYSKTYRTELEKRLASGVKPKSARFQAHLHAQRIVVATFKVTERHVRKSIIPYE